MPGTLFVVATPIGNLDDITLRALRILGNVALIASEDTRRTAHLLVRHGISTATTSFHEHNEQHKTPSLVARLLRGEDIAIVSDAGTPTISDPGTRLIRAAIEAGIKVEPIPGANAAIAALSISGLSTNEFAFLGFPPIKSIDRKSWFSRLRNTGGVVVFYEAPHRLERTLSDFLELVGDRPAILARELTKIHEELVRGPISEVFSKLRSAKGEFTVIVDVGSPLPVSPIVGQSTENASANLRATVADFANRLGLPPNELYRAVTKLKNMGEMTDTD